jgi:hypothetical protein
MTGVEKLAQIAVKAGITIEDMQEIVEQPVCPMYRKLADVLESRFERHSKEYKIDYTSRYAEDTDESLEEVITELFESEGYNDSNFYVSDRSIYDNSGYDTGYCTISWISKHTKKLEAFDFQWEIV